MDELDGWNDDRPRASNEVYLLRTAVALLLTGLIGLLAWVWTFAHGMESRLSRLEGVNEERTVQLKRIDDASAALAGTIMQMLQEKRSR